MPVAIGEMRLFLNGKAAYCAIVVRRVYREAVLAGTSCPVTLM